MEGSFMLSRVKRLDKDSAPCTEDTTTSLTSCIKVFLLTIMTCKVNQTMKEILNHCWQKYLTHQVGCNLDLLGQGHDKEERGENQVEIMRDHEGEACFTNARLKALYSLFIW